MDGDGMDAGRWSLVMQVAGAVAVVVAVAVIAGLGWAVLAGGVLLLLAGALAEAGAAPAPRESDGVSR